MPSLLIPTHGANDHVSDSQDSAHESLQSSAGLGSAATLASHASQSSNTSFADYEIAASPTTAAGPQSSAVKHHASQTHENLPSPVASTLTPLRPSIDVSVAAAAFSHTRPSTPPPVDSSSGRSQDNTSGTSLRSGPSSLSPVRGIKRAANGAPKDFVPSCSPPPVDDHHVPYASLPAESPRRIRAKQAVERMQLKLRLAQFKVNHGLQNKTMKEIGEMIAPISAPAYSPIPYERCSTSPQAALRQTVKHTRNMSSIGSTTDMLRGLHTTTLPSQHQRCASSELQLQEPILAPPPDLASAPQSRPYSRVSTPTPREQEALESLMQMATPTTSTFPGQARLGS